MSLFDEKVYSKHGKKRSARLLENGYNKYIFRIFWRDRICLCNFHFRKSIKTGVKLISE